MDLSAVIFVALALAWAVYLIPKALKHHDEMAGERLVEGHSDKVRILSRRSRAGAPEVEVEIEHVDTVERTTQGKRATARPATTRAAARKAARRRRRVLGVLVVALAAVWALTWLAYLPIWAPAAPGALIVLFLVVTRLSVRRASVGRRTVIEPKTVVDPRTVVEPAQTKTESVDRLAEDTVGVARSEIEAAIAAEGSLWDPLPMTLPTYVNKARARRTVRTIELTGINSSGHDQADTALAREAQESAHEKNETEGSARKAAGA